MQTQMMIAIGLSSVLAAVVGGGLYLGETESPEVGGGEQGVPIAVEQTNTQDPFLQEYQELEKLLEETRAQRKRQQVKLAQQMGIETETAVPVAEEKRAPAEVALQEVVSQSQAEQPPSKVKPAEAPKKPVVAQRISTPKPVVAEVTPETTSEAPPSKLVVQAKSPKAKEVALKSEPATAPVERREVVAEQEPVASVKKSVVTQPLPIEKAKVPELQVAPAVTKQEVPQAASTPKVIAQVKPQVKSLAKPIAKVQEKPKPKPKQKAKSKSKRKNHIQMATFTSKKRAEAVVKDLRDAHFNAEVVSVKSRGKRYYLVRDYSPKNRKEALALKKVYDGWLKVDSLVRY